MVKAIREQVTIQPGGRIEVRSPELAPGRQAEVIVLLDEERPQRSLRSWIGAAKGCFETPDEVDEFLRRERDSWD